jgi:hypothetical protein
VKIFLLQATILLMFLLQAAAMVLLPCVVLQVNIHHLHLDLRVQDRLLAQLLLGLLRRLLLVRLVLEALLVTEIEIIGWEGMGWIFHLLLRMIDHLLLLDIMLEAAVLGMDGETHVTEVNMEDPDSLSLQSVFLLRSSSFLILLAHVCSSSISKQGPFFISVLIYLFFFAKSIDLICALCIYHPHCLLRTFVLLLIIGLFFLDTLFVLVVVMVNISATSHLMIGSEMYKKEIIIYPSTGS